jgi:protein involved in polysaccharide export with SLBB domain
MPDLARRGMALLLAATLLVPASALRARTAEEQDEETDVESELPEGGSVGFDLTVPDTDVVEEAMREGAMPLGSGPLTEPIDPERYVVGPGDQFVINFWGQRSEHVPIAISAEGVTFIPAIGQLRAGPVTLAEFKRLISRKLASVYQGLQWDVLLKKPRTFGLYVLGNVKKPGLYQANGAARVSTVLSRAGGPLKSGSYRRVEIRRDGKTLTADLLKFVRFADRDANPYVRENDVIFVPYRGKVVAIGGPVRRPGYYELLDGEDRFDVLFNVLGGGALRTVLYTEPARIWYVDDAGKPSTIAFDLKRALADPAYAATLPLVDGARVKVLSVEVAAPTVRVVGAVYGTGDRNVYKLRASAGELPRETTQVFGLSAGETARDLVAKAGGATPWAHLRAAYVLRAAPEGGSPVTIPVDLEKILVRHVYDGDVALEPGDVLTVPALDDRVYVVGQVRAPGPTPFQPSLTAREYIGQAGGPTERAAARRAYVEHSDGTKVKIKDDPTVKPGDKVVVPEVRVRWWQDYFTILLAAASVALAGIAATK